MSIFCTVIEVPAPMEQKPDKLGPYELLLPIGEGGMGEVWKAHDPRLNRDVAIKISAQQFIRGYCGRTGGKGEQCDGESH